MTRAGRPARFLLLLLPGLLAACSEAETPLERQARQWLVTTYPEADAPSLELRNVRPVGGRVCGEARFRFRGADVGYRLFTYAGIDGIFETPLPRQLLPHTPPCDFTRDEILSVCASSAAARQEAELRVLRCQMQARY
jgi:hypothetical protein